MKIAIVNGPNMNLIGRREPEIYGTQPLDDYLNELESRYPEVHFMRFQSNHEGALIDYLQQVGFDNSVSAIILNAAAYTHTSLALADTIAAIPTPVVEVHISNPKRRKPALRRTSLLSPVVVASFAGFGLRSYQIAVDFICESYNE